MAYGARLCVFVLVSMLTAAFGAGAGVAATADAPAAAGAAVPAATASATTSSPAAPTVADAPVKKPVKSAARVAPKQKAAADLKPTGAANVYLFRGFLGVFSLGMDRLNDKLKANGVKTKLLGHTEWRSVVAEIVAEAARSPKGKYPLVIVGHSLGANAALVLARELGEKGVPVTLVLTVDPTVSKPVTASVGRYLNIYQENNGFGVALDGAGISPKKLQNYNTWQHTNLTKPDVTHFTLDKNADVQQQMYDAIMKALRR